MNRVIAFCAALLLAGCSSIPSNPFAVDGSRADGKIIMHSGTTTDMAVEVNWQSQEHVALEKCLDWGFNGVEPFGGARSRILTVDEWGVRFWEHERVYQCTTGNPVD